MKCPFCQSAETRVVDSRPVEDGAALRRRRLCEGCGARFTTHERHQSAVLMVVKKDGRREEFSASKLRSGLAKACNKRPVATEDVERSAGEIEAQLRRDGGAEVSSDRVGELVMEKLFSLDQVAYVRFASVYQRFDDVKRFAQILERISRRKSRQSRARTGNPQNSLIPMISRSAAPTQIAATLLRREEVAPRHFLFALRAPDIARQAQAGQFVHILPRSFGLSDPLLRRAFSIMAAQDEIVSILFRADGRGTSSIAAAQVGDALDLLGPLGLPFDLSMFHVKQAQNIVPILVGGGIGVPPLVLLCLTLQGLGAAPQVLIGAKSAAETIGEAQFHAQAITPLFSTDDGSRGHHGRVSDPLRQSLERIEENGLQAVVYACGPAAMLKAVAQVAAQFATPCQVSLEENMPCGIGVCNGCMVAMKAASEAGTSDYDRYRRVCIEGPAVWAADVDWEAF